MCTVVDFIEYSEKKKKMRSCRYNLLDYVVLIKG